MPDTNTTAAVLSGSTDSPIQDGLTRGALVAAIQGLASFAAIRLNITVEELGMLSPAITFVGFAAYALVDKFLRGRVTERAVSPV